MTQVYYTFCKDVKKQSQAGKALLDFVLREYYHMGDYELKRTELGKPYIDGHPVHFSISHSGHAVVLAVSDEPVGVDVEPMRYIRPKVIKRFTGEELTDKKECLLAWLRHESYGKMTGEGISVREPRVTHHYHYYELTLFDIGYYLCVCSPIDAFPDGVTPCSVQAP